jgi:Tfp pilus assembly protein PilX
MLRNNRDGFALPMAVLALGLITAGVMAAFTRAGAEARTVDNQQEQQAAFGVANAGLERYLAEARFLSGDTITGRTFSFVDGNAHVMVHVMRNRAHARDTTILLIRSIGTVNRDNVGAGRPAATRTVAQLAWRPAGSMQVQSAWTSLSGLRKDGVAGDITGHDACSGTSLPGVAVPDGTFSGHDDAISGNPAIAYMGTQAQMASTIKIDWAGITNPLSPSLSPTHIVCVPGSNGYDARFGPCSGWPTSSTYTDSWPVVLINGSYKGIDGGAGRGMIIATGDFELLGGDSWSGIVLVGGEMHDRGTGAVAGAVISGLNVLKGMAVNEASRAHGTKSYTYDSCAVADAASGAARVIPIANAWVDNWSTW